MFYLKELHAKGYSIRAIACITGHDRKTVRKYINAQLYPRYKHRRKKPSKLEPYKEYILSRLREGMFNCSVLLEEIRAQGYTGGKTILKDFVAQYRPLQRAQAVQRFEPRPGQQAQVDWAYFSYLDGDRKRIIYAFVFVLSYSRFIYVEFTERMDLDTLLRCLLNAFEACGGVPEEVLFDNMKQVVLSRDENGQPEWHPRFADFAALVGFRPKACRPYRAQTKGRVERCIRFVRENFWPGRRFVDLEDLNQCRPAAGAARSITGSTARLRQSPQHGWLRSRCSPCLTASGWSICWVRCARSAGTPLSPGREADTACRDSGQVPMW